MFPTYLGTASCPSGARDHQAGPLWRRWHRRRLKGSEFGGALPSFIFVLVAINRVESYLGHGRKVGMMPAWNDKSSYGSIFFELTEVLHRAIRNKPGIIHTKLHESKCERGLSDGVWIRCLVQDFLPMSYRECTKLSGQCIGTIQHICCRLGAKRPWSYTVRGCSPTLVTCKITHTRKAITYS